MTISTRWTVESRARQAALIRTWRPWTRSTGPRSAEGKAISARNCGGPNRIRQELLELEAAIRRA